jgi:hypothetical protein
MKITIYGRKGQYILLTLSLRFCEQFVIEEKVRAIKHQLATAKLNEK